MTEGSRRKIQRAIYQQERRDVGGLEETDCAKGTGWREERSMHLEELFREEFSWNFKET